MAPMMGIENWQDKMPNWKADIIDTIMENGGKIKLSEVKAICGFNANS